MKCPGCNNENVGDAKVCMWCGKDMVPKAPVSRAKKITRIVGCLLVCLFILWLFDAPAIKNDYTVADLKSAAPQYNSSFEVLTGLAEYEKDPNGAPAIGLSAEDVNAVEGVSDVLKRGDIARAAEAVKADAARIEKAWADGAKGRGIIDKLAEYPEIADLSEPVSFEQQDKDIMDKCWGSIRQLAYLYRVHICLEVERGNDRAAVEELIRFDSVFRKFNVNARSLGTKLVCEAILTLDMATADYIANRPQTSPATLTLLAGHFQRLDGSQISLRNAFIFDYLKFGKALGSMRSKKLKWYPGLGNRRNTTCRYYRNFIDQWIAKSEGMPVTAGGRLNVWPVIGPRWIDVETTSNPSFRTWPTYALYNPIGGMLVKIVAPAMEKVLELRTQWLIHDDMLQAVLNKRLGREVNLKARAYGYEYIIDVAGKRITNAGPDEKTGTKDDIWLAIDPNVVRFGKMGGE